MRISGPYRTPRDDRPVCAARVPERPDHAARARTGSQSVERALSLVRCLAASDDDLGVTDVAARTGLSVSTAHRLLQALRADGLVAQDPRTERYHLGPGLVALGRRAEARVPFDHLLPALDGAGRRDR